MNLKRMTMLAAALAAGIAAAQDPGKVLMLTKSVSFQHPVVERRGEKLGLAERTVQELGKEYGFDVEITKDASTINSDNLKKYGAVFFYTQGDLTQPGKLDPGPVMKKEDRPSILEFVKNGGGFVGTHCGGADTFNHNFWEENRDGRLVKPFCEMVGAEFISHGPQQVARVETVDKSFPAVAHWPASFALNDEWYAYDGFHKNMRILMMLQTEGMKGKDYARNSYPITWCSEYGKGRVFYTGMGHREDVWENPNYRKMVGTAVKWSLKKIDGDATPNLKEVLGDEEKGLQRINPPKTRK